MIVDYKDYGLRYCRRSRFDLVSRFITWISKKRVNALAAYVWLLCAFLSLSFNYYLLDLMGR